jgi:hypothetical protein
MNRLPSLTLKIVSVPLVAVFTASGILLLAQSALVPSLSMGEYPDWVRILCGLAQIGGGFLLLVPRVAWYAAGLLAVLMGGLVLTAVQQGEPAQAWAPAVLLVLVSLVGYGRLPRLVTRARLQAVMDAFAEREMARDRLFNASRTSGVRS